MYGKLALLDPQAPRRGSLFTSCRYLRTHFRNDYRLAPFGITAVILFLLQPESSGALGLHPTPIIPAETAQVPRPLRRDRPRQGKFHIRDICCYFAWPPLQLTFKAGTACPTWATEQPRGISDAATPRTSWVAIQWKKRKKRFKIYEEFLKKKKRPVEFREWLIQVETKKKDDVGLLLKRDSRRGKKGSKRLPCIVKITRIDTAKQSMPRLLRTFRASEQKFWKDGSASTCEYWITKSGCKKTERERTAREGEKKLRRKLTV